MVLVVVAARVGVMSSNWHQKKGGKEEAPIVIQVWFLLQLATEENARPGVKSFGRH